MKKLWFKAKRYGYGWYPATWQGWLAVLTYVALILGNAYRFGQMNLPEDQVPVGFVIQSIVLTIALITISALTGEKARWRWGEDEKK